MNQTSVIEQGSSGDLSDFFYHPENMLVITGFLLFLCAITINAFNYRKIAKYIQFHKNTQMLMVSLMLVTSVLALTHAANSIDLIIKILLYPMASDFLVQVGYCTHWLFLMSNSMMTLLQVAVIVQAIEATKYPYKFCDRKTSTFSKILIGIIILTSIVIVYFVMNSENTQGFLLHATDDTTSMFKALLCVEFLVMILQLYFYNVNYEIVREKTYEESVQRIFEQKLHFMIAERDQLRVNSGVLQRMAPIVAVSAFTKIFYLTALMFEPPIPMLAENPFIVEIVTLFAFSFLSLTTALLLTRILNLEDDYLEELRIRIQESSPWKMDFHATLGVFYDDVYAAHHDENGKPVTRKTRGSLTSLFTVNTWYLKSTA